MKLISAYLIMVNIATFIIFGMDKYKARNKGRRTPESTLLMLAAIGGSIGAWLAMYVFRHKTKHKKFVYGVPAIILAQIVIVLLSSCGTKKSTIAELPKETVSGRHFQEFSPTTLIIMYDAEVGKEFLLKAIKENKAEIIYDYSIIPGMAIRKPESMTLDEAIAFFKKVKGVKTVEKDYIHHLTDPVKPVLVDR